MEKGEPCSQACETRCLGLATWLPGLGLAEAGLAGAWLRLAWLGLAEAGLGILGIRRIAESLVNPSRAFLAN